MEIAVLVYWNIILRQKNWMPFFAALPSLTILGSVYGFARCCICKIENETCCFFAWRPASFLEILADVHFSAKFGFACWLGISGTALELYFDWISAVPNDHLYGILGLLSVSIICQIKCNPGHSNFTGKNGNFVYTSDINVPTSHYGDKRGTYGFNWMQAIRNRNRY